MNDLISTCDPSSADHACKQIEVRYVESFQTISFSFWASAASCLRNASMSNSTGSLFPFL